MHFERKLTRRLTNYLTVARSILSSSIVTVTAMTASRDTLV
jgi:hypothetical protein